MTTCLISLGGNVGDVAQTIDQALARLHEPPWVTVLQRSSLHRTSPVGSAVVSEFINAAAKLETSLSAQALLERMLAVETELGRVRAIHWGPRTIDLDLICFGDSIIEDSPTLRVPHPACWYRRFVLDPLAEIAADFVHPQKKLSICQLRDRLLPRPLLVGVVCGELAQIDMVDSLRPSFPDVRFLTLQSGDDCQDELALLIWSGSGPSPAWTERFHSEPGWLDGSSIPGEPHQILSDILRSAGCGS